MKFHPDETNYSVIARGSGVTRHTAAKWYEMIRGQGDVSSGRDKMTWRLQRNYLSTVGETVK